MTDQLPAAHDRIANAVEQLVTGAQLFLMPGYNPATKATVQLVQNEQQLSRPAACEFGSETPCVGGAKANELVHAIVASTQRLDNRLLTLFLVW